MQVNWLALLLILHIGGAALWTGLMAAALLVVRPALGLPEAGDRLGLQMAMFRRLFAILASLMPLTLVTGWIIAALAYGRPMLWPWALSAMQTAGLAMGGVFLLIRLGPFVLLHEAWETGDKDEITAQRERICRLMAISCGLGGISLVFGVLLQY